MMIQDIAWAYGLKLQPWLVVSRGDDLIVEFNRKNMLKDFGFVLEEAATEDGREDHVRKLKERKEILTTLKPGPSINTPHSFGKIIKFSYILLQVLIVSYLHAYTIVMKQLTTQTN